MCCENHVSQHRVLLLLRPPVILVRFPKVRLHRGTHSLRAGVLSLGLALGSLFMGYVLMLEIYLNSFRMSCAEAVVHVSHFLGHRLRLPELEDLSFSAVYNVIAWQTNTLTNGERRLQLTPSPGCDVRSLRVLRTHG